ncbi:MAG: glycosyltransferase family 4 protein [Sedimentisphaerales bacterium]|jgi:glycosyltransferase involved in cell wall biosynthesis
MKIVFFDFVISFGGGPQLAADTAIRLAAEHDVEIVDVYGVCTPYLKMFAEAGIKVHVMVPEAKNVYIGYSNQKLIRAWRIIRQLPVLWKLRRRLIRKIREINPDVIWTDQKQALLLLGLSFQLRHYPLAMEVIGGPDVASIRGYGKWLIKHRLSIVMAICSETAKQLQSIGVPKDKIHVVFDTIDFKDTLERSRHVIESPLPFLEGRPRILVPATIIPAKGQDTAIRAVSHLKSEGLEPVLWMAGDVIVNDYSYYDYLKKIIEDLGLKKNVHLLGWRNDVPAIMTQADIVILPTHSEGFGHVILEAMLLKVPVIATAVGGIKDSVENNANGILIKVNDDKALADGINKIVSEPLFAKRLIENAYQTVTQRFAPENHTKLFIEALNKAIESQRRH